MWYKPLNYSEPMQHFKDQWLKIWTGVDTLVYELQMTKSYAREIATRFQQMTLNTNTDMYTLWAIKDIEFISEYTQWPYSTTCTIRMHHEQFTIPAFQFHITTELSKLTVYWLTFRVCELFNLSYDVIMKHLLERYTLQLTGRIIRCDFRFDIHWITPQTFIDQLKKTQLEEFSKRTLETRVNQWQTNTIYIWNRKSRTCYVRVYNKYEDSKKKWKLAFYHDYSNPTTRIEFQMGSQFIWVLDLDGTIKKLLSYVGFPSERKWNYFVVNRSSEEYILDIQKYTTNWVNRTIKLMKNWIDLRQNCKEVNKSQDNYRIRVNLPQRLP